MGGGKTPTAPPPPKPPVSDMAGEKVASDMAKERKRQGFQSTILTGAQVNQPANNTVKKTLLGQ